MLQVAQNSVNEGMYTQVSNGRFKGGYITRHYGQPQQGVHAIQLELSQDTYLQHGYKQDGNYVLSPEKLDTVTLVLNKLLKGLIAWRP
jgi:formiminoglutamase